MEEGSKENKNESLFVSAENGRTYRSNNLILSIDLVIGSHTWVHGSRKRLLQDGGGENLGLE